MSCPIRRRFDARLRGQAGGELAFWSNLRPHRKHTDPKHGYWEPWLPSWMHGMACQDFERGPPALPKPESVCNPISLINHKHQDSSPGRHLWVASPDFPCMPGVSHLIICRPVRAGLALLGAGSQISKKPESEDGGASLLPVPLLRYAVTSRSA